MKVSELMSKHIEAVPPDYNIRQASRWMRDHNVGSLPVLNNGKLVGIVTDRDISCYAVAMGRDPSSTLIQNVMTTEVATCYVDDDITDAAHLMEQRHIRRLAVLDHDNKVIGLLSVDDLARGSHELAGAVLESAEAIH